ncbi:MAG TPA: hypothetical protein DHV24_06075 [Candidatus Margulisbacteria bacterium]|nr:hypothetical protein [Candidatus Margulisiibacteriota bacterium]
MDDDGNALNEVHWEGILTHIASTSYHKMDIIDANIQSYSFSFNQEDTDINMITGEGDHGKQVALALWQHDTGEAYSIEVLYWTKVGSDTGWVPAEDLYPEYFKKVVAYYQEKVKEMPEAAYYWYYLADAQGKANLPENALKSITRGKALKSGYPEDFHWLMVKGEALNKLGKYEEASSTLINVIQGLEREKDDYMKKDYLIKAYFDLEQSYAGLKETDKAKAAYEKSLELIKQITSNPGPRSLPVQRALEKL